MLHNATLHQPVTQPGGANTRTWDLFWTIETNLSRARAIAPCADGASFAKCALPLCSSVRFTERHSPGCPSPTDSDVNMKEPSSSRSLILDVSSFLFSCFFFYVSSKTQCCQEVQVPQFPPPKKKKQSRGDLKAALYSYWSSLREKARRPSRVQNSTSAPTWPNIYG